MMSLSTVAPNNSNLVTSEFPTVQFEGDSTTYVSPSWNQLSGLAFTVATAILNRDLHFDSIVTLAKGGWPMTRTLVDFLSVGQVASIGVKFYAGIKERLKQPEIYQDIPVSVSGESVLLFDDVADTGESLKFVMDYLGDRGVSRVTTASLFYKPHSIVKPDFFGAEVTGWIVFPYELVETLRVLNRKWRDAGLDQSQIIARFTKLGFQADQVNWYISRF